MVSREEVTFEAATQNSSSPNKAHLRGSEIPKSIPYYTGAQIFINSDRVVLNSKRKELSLFSKTEINLSAISNITAASEKNIIVSANQDIQLKADDDITLDSKNITLTSVDNIATNSNNFTISAKKIYLGSSGNIQPMVLGDNLVDCINELIAHVNPKLPSPPLGDIL